MKKDLIKIVGYYGINKQLKYMQSEIFELNEAVIRYQESLRNPIDIILNVLEPMCAFIGNREQKDQLADVKGEIADVMVMLRQIQYNYGIKDDEITEIMKQKISRQLERIDAEKKEVSTNNENL